MLQAQPRQAEPSSTENFAQALKLSRLRDAPAVRKGSAGNMASIAAGLVPAITQYTGHISTIRAHTRTLHTVN